MNSINKILDMYNRGNQGKFKIGCQKTYNSTNILQKILFFIL